MGKLLLGKPTNYGTSISIRLCLHAEYGPIRLQKSLHSISFKGNIRIYSAMSIKPFPTMQLQKATKSGLSFYSQLEQKPRSRRMNGHTRMLAIGMN